MILMAAEIDDAGVRLDGIDHSAIVERRLLSPVCRAPFIAFAVLLSLTAAVFAETADPREDTFSRIEEQGLRNWKNLPALNKRDFSRCLGSQFNVESEYLKIEKEREAIDVNSRELEPKLALLHEREAELRQDEEEIKATAQMLKFKTEEFSKRRAVIDKLRSKNPLTQTEVNKLNADIRSFNADLGRDELQRTHFNSRLEEYKSKLEKLDQEVTQYNDQIALFQVRASNHQSSVLKFNESVKFLDNKCSGTRVINLGDEPALELSK